MMGHIEVPPLARGGQRADADRRSALLASAQAPPITVISREGRKPLPVTAINNQDYVAVDDVNAAFGRRLARIGWPAA